MSLFEVVAEIAESHKLLLLGNSYWFSAHCVRLGLRLLRTFPSLLSSVLVVCIATYMTQISDFLSPTSLCCLGNFNSVFSAVFTYISAGILQISPSVNSCHLTEPFFVISLSP